MEKCNKPLTHCDTTSLSAIPTHVKSEVHPTSERQRTVSENASNFSGSSLALAGSVPELTGAVSEDVIQEKTESTRYKDPNIDGGYAWVIVFAAGLAYFIGGALARIFTFVYFQLLIKFESSATATAWVNSLNGVLKMCSSPLVAAFIHRFGSRPVAVTGGVIAGVGLILTSFPVSLASVYISYGFFTGIGVNMVHTTCFITIGQYFEKQKGKAMGLALVALGIGGLTLTPLMEFLFRYYGYTGAMLVLSAVSFHYCVGGALLRPSPKRYDEIIIKNTKITDEDQTKFISTTEQVDDVNLKPDDVQNDDLYKQIKSSADSLKQSLGEVDTLQIKTNKSEPKETCQKVRTTLRKYFGFHLLKNVRYLSFCMFMATVFAAAYSAFAFLSVLALEIADIPTQDLAVILAVSSALEIPARMLAGILFDIQCLKRFRAAQFFCFGFSSGLMMIILAYTGTSYYSFFVLNVIQQCLDAMLHTQHIPVLSDIVGTKELGSATGLMRFFMGIGILIGPILGGLLKDYTGTYVYSFTLVGAAMMCCGVQFLIIQYWSMSKR